MSKYDIPTSCDDEWQQEMLRKLAGRLERIQDDGGITSQVTNEQLDDAVAIVEALREYSGY